MARDSSTARTSCSTRARSPCSAPPPCSLCATAGAATPSTHQPRSHAPPRASLRRSRNSHCSDRQTRRRERHRMHLHSRRRRSSPRSRRCHLYARRCPRKRTRKRPRPRTRPRAGTFAGTRAGTRAGTNAGRRRRSFARCALRPTVADACVAMACRRRVRGRPARGCAMAARAAARAEPARRNSCRRAIAAAMRRRGLESKETRERGAQNTRGWGVRVSAGARRGRVRAGFGRKGKRQE
eukprot:4299856-Pleurochrysis_carterae.AAC.1